MFGDKPIVGQTILRIKKDRIILPSFTHVEAGDIVSGTIDPYKKKIILLQEKELIERLTILQKKLEQARKEGRINPVEYRNIQRYYWGILPLHDRRITKKLEYQIFNRRSVATYELREVQKLNLRDEVFAVGVGTTLEIYPDENSYHEYQKMIEQKKQK